MVLPPLSSHKLFVCEVASTASLRQRETATFSSRLSDAHYIKKRISVQPYFRDGRGYNRGMFDHRRKRRALAREVAKLDEELLPKVERAKLEYKHAAPGGDFSVVVESDYKWRRQRLEIELAVLEARRLFRLAKRYGAVGTPQQEIDDPAQTGDQSRRYFKPHNQEAFERMIADARFALWKKWIDLLSPVISIVIAIIALIVSIIAINRT